jgi:DNA invertase Pin-like site-specific DNA recombinase
MQRPTSVEDQIRECRDAAQRNGWTVLEEFIRSDEALTGQFAAGRDGLDDLMRLAHQSPRPFDCILIDDTSRFGRNLSDTLPMSDRLEYLEVFLYFVSRRLDSRDPNFRTIFVQLGQQDEQFSRGSGEKVHRGQRGRVLNGFIGGGRAYGYRNVPIENPHRKGLYGRPVVDSVKLEINPEEAANVVRIFELSVSGLGQNAIAKRLNAEGVPSPLQGQSRSRRRRVWTPGNVRDILRNEKYRGVHIWNKTKIVRNPIARRKEQRRRPASEWERVEVPEWRIVPEELWNAVREENKIRSARCWRTDGGLNRTESSREYLFSGLMLCGHCGGKFNIVYGKGPSARYGCNRYRKSGTCDNGLSIMRRTLEEQLLNALKQNILNPEVRERLCKDFHRQVEVTWKEQISNAQKLRSELPALKAKQHELEEQARNLVNAIAQTGGSVLLYEKLRSVETQMQSVEQLSAKSTQAKTDVPSPEVIQEFLDRKFADFNSVLTSAPELAKQKLRKYVHNLVMRALPSKEAPKYEVTGDIRLFAPADDPAEEDNVLLDGSIYRSNKQYTFANIPFRAELNARSARRMRSRVTSDVHYSRMIQGHQKLSSSRPGEQRTQFAPEVFEADVSETLNTQASRQVSI